MTVTAPDAGPGPLAAIPDVHVPLVLTAAEPVLHGAGISGNTQLLRTQDVLLPDGRRTAVPYVSGNSLRHVLRSALAWHLVRLLDVPDGSLSKLTVDLLWSGGSLTQTGSSADLATGRRVHSLVRVVQAINQARRGMTKRNLAVHWQPFCPLPGTPMQWCPAGHGARRMASMLDGMRLDWLKFRQAAGRTDGMAGVCTVLSRSAGEPAARLLEALAAGPVTTARAEEITGTLAGQLDPDGPLPWDFIATAHDRGTLRRAYDAMLARLAAG